MKTTQATLTPLQVSALSTLSEQWHDLMSDCDSPAIMLELYQLFMCASCSPQWDVIFYDDCKRENVVVTMDAIYRSLDAIRVLLCVEDVS